MISNIIEKLNNFNKETVPGALQRKKREEQELGTCE
jgi:hypothetical protein